MEINASHAVASISTLPNELYTKILDYLDNPHDWNSFMLTCKQYGILGRRYLLPRIQTLAVFASTTTLATSKNSYPFHCISTGARGPQIVATPFRYSPQKPRLPIHRLEQYFRHTLPYLWRHAINLQEIIIRTDMPLTHHPTHIAPEHSPYYRLLCLLNQLQRDYPKRITAFHLMTPIAPPFPIFIHLLTHWITTIQQISLLSTGIPFKYWLPLLQLYPLTHLRLFLGPYCLDENHTNLTTEIDFAPLETLLTQPDSKIQALELHFCNHKTHGSQPPLNQTMFARLIMTIPSNTHLTVGFPTSAWPTPNVPEVWQTLLATLPYNLDHHTPIQRNLTTLSLGPTLQNQSVLSTSFLTLFPALQEITGLFCNDQLLTSIALTLCDKPHSPLLILRCVPIPFSASRISVLLQQVDHFCTHLMHKALDLPPDLSHLIKKCRCHCPIMGEYAARRCHITLTPKYPPLNHTRSKLQLDFEHLVQATCFRLIIPIYSETNQEFRHRMLVNHSTRFSY
jgi:hypothetical protein